MARRIVSWTALLCAAAVWGIGSERDIQAGISPAGHWVGTIGTGVEQIEMIVDINRSLNGSWVGEAFQAPIGLDTEPAWDVYLVYERDASWNEDSPPEPSFFMHRLGGRLPPELHLDGPTLADHVRRELGQNAE